MFLGLERFEETQVKSMLNLCEIKELVNATVISSILFLPLKCQARISALMQ